MKLINLLIPLLILSLCSCSKSSDSQSADNGNNRMEKPIKKTVSLTSEDIKQIIKSQKLECGENNCPDAVARVLSIGHDGKLGLCSSFLVSKDIIATNRHCLSEKMSFAKGASCKDLMYFTFEDRGVAREKLIVGCDKLLDLSSEENPYLDYALLKLEQKMNRKPFDINTQGIDDRIAIDLWRINHSDDVYSSVIVKEECMSVMGGVTAPFYTDPFVDSVLISELLDDKGGCKVVHGNSGSVAINQNGEAIGIVSDTFKSELFNNDEFLEQFGLDRVANMGLISNFSCIKNSIVHGRFCNTDEDALPKKLFVELQEDLAKELEVQNESSVFYWGLRDSDFAFDVDNEDDSDDADVMVIRSVPNCYRTELLYDNQLSTSPISWFVDVQYSNKYMIPEMKRVEVETPEMFTYNLSRVDGDVFEVSLDDFTGSSDVFDTYSKFSPIQIGACD